MVIFHSEPMMGYSIDNIAPGVPDGLMAVKVNEDNIVLSLNPSNDEDFNTMWLRKSLDMSFKLT